MSTDSAVWGLEGLQSWLWPQNAESRRGSDSARNQKQGSLKTTVTADLNGPPTLSRPSKPARLRRLTVPESVEAPASHLGASVKPQQKLFPEVAGLSSSVAERLLMRMRRVKAHASREDGFRAYRIDNLHLSAGTNGLAYRRSMRLKDKTSECVPWGTVVYGRKEGDGWLRVGSRYLPMMLNNAMVVFPVTLETSSLGQGAPIFPGTLPNRAEMPGSPLRAVSSSARLRPPSRPQSLLRKQMDLNIRSDSAMCNSLHPQPLKQSQSLQIFQRSDGPGSASCALKTADVSQWLWPDQGSLTMPSAPTSTLESTDSLALSAASEGDSATSGRSRPLQNADVSDWLWPRRDDAQESQEKSALPLKDETSSADRAEAEFGHLPSPAHLHTRLHDGGMAHSVDAVAVGNAPLSHSGVASSVPSNMPLNTTAAASPTSSANTFAQPLPSRHLTVLPQHHPPALVPGITVAPQVNYRVVLLELEMDADHPYHMKMTQVPKHLADPLQHSLHVQGGLHGGPPMALTPHPSFHAFLAVRQPYLDYSPQPVAVAPDSASIVPGPSSVPDPTQSVAAQHSGAAATAPIAIVQPTHSQAAASTSTLIPAQLSSFIQSGFLFGSISAAAMEITQIAFVEQGSIEHLSLEKHGPQIAGAAARGAGIGAVGASLAFVLGPVAPTAILVGYGVGRECYDQMASWQQNEVLGNDAAEHVLEVFLGATGGVSAAWGTAMLLSGMGGVTIAAAAGCCGFGGNLAGRRLGMLVVNLLNPKLSEKERRLILAYAELGVDQNCTDKELELAFRKAALARHPDKARPVLQPCVPGSHERFAKLSSAMNRIRVARGMVRRPQRGSSMSTVLPLSANSI